MKTQILALGLRPWEYTDKETGKDYAGTSLVFVLEDFQEIHRTTIKEEILAYAQTHASKLPALFDVDVKVTSFKSKIKYDFTSVKFVKEVALFPKV
jgi:hypothetical protein